MAPGYIVNFYILYIFLTLLLAVLSHLLMYKLYLKFTLKMYFFMGQYDIFFKTVLVPPVNQSK